MANRKGSILWNIHRVYGLGLALLVTSMSAAISGCGACGDAAATLAEATLTVAPSTATVVVGGTQQYHATLTLSNGEREDVTDSSSWTSSNPTIATLGSGSGLATGASVGTITVTAIYHSLSGMATLNVIPPGPVLVSLVVAPPTATVDINGTQQYTATANYSDGSMKDVTTASAWTSSNTAIATIGGNNGLATGVAAGTITVTATYQALSGTAMLNVLNPPVSLVVTPATATIQVTATQQYTATATYSNGNMQNVTTSSNWISSNTAVATITAGGGLATGVSAGTITVTATYQSLSATAMLIVIPNPVQSACTPANAVTTVTNGTSVVAYVPNSSKGGTGDLPGVNVVPLEPIPVASAATVATAGDIDGCAGNSQTQEVVCTDIDQGVYLITGTTLNTTLTSAATYGVAEFTGGSCGNCAVAINAQSNTAVIGMGLESSPSNSGFQFLDLATNRLSAPVATLNEISENVQWDPMRNLILSPDEGLASEGFSSTYDLFQVGTNNALTEFANATSAPPPNFWDSAGEDCTTGIATATSEGSSPAGIYITDLTQATFVTGSPGTWSAPGQYTTFPDFDNIDSALFEPTGFVAVPGFHLALVYGESCASPNPFAVVVLPATSGSGTPAFGDYAVALTPNTPDGNAFVPCADPHPLSGYVSPNDGRAYGILANIGGYISPAPPTYIAVIDLQALLDAPREAGTHIVDPSYNLITNGVVRYVPTPNASGNVRGDEQRRAAARALNQELLRDYQGCCLLQLPRVRLTPDAKRP